MLPGDCEEGFVKMVGLSPVSIVGWILLGVTFSLGDGDRGWGGYVRKGKIEKVKGWSEVGLEMTMRKEHKFSPSQDRYPIESTRGSTRYRILYLKRIYHKE